MIAASYSMSPPASRAESARSDTTAEADHLTCAPDWAIYLSSPERGRAAEFTGLKSRASTIGGRRKAVSQRTAVGYFASGRQCEMSSFSPSSAPPLELLRA